MSNRERPVERLHPYFVIYLMALAFMLGIAAHLAWTQIEAAGDPALVRAAAVRMLIGWVEKKGMTT